MLKFIFLGMLIQQIIFLIVALATNEDNEKCYFVGLGLTLIPIVILQYIYKWLDIRNRKIYIEIIVDNKHYYITGRNYRRDKKIKDRLVEEGRFTFWQEYWDGKKATKNKTETPLIKSLSCFGFDD